jgi:hypothetical protein
MNAFDAKALVAQAESRAQRQRCPAEEVEEPRRELAAVPVVNPGMYENSAYGWRRYEEDLHTRDMLISSLRQREAELLARIKRRVASLRRNHRERRPGPWRHAATFVGAHA